jgi:hypothetical protein
MGDGRACDAEVVNQSYLVGSNDAVWPSSPPPAAKAGREIEPGVGQGEGGEGGRGGPRCDALCSNGSM